MKAAYVIIAIIIALAIWADAAYFILFHTKDLVLKNGEVDYWLKGTCIVISLICTGIQTFIYLDFDVYSKKHLLINLVGVFIATCATQISTTAISYLIFEYHLGWILLGVGYLILAAATFITGTNNAIYPGSAFGVSWSIMAYLEKYNDYEEKVTELSHLVKQHQ